MVLLYIKLILFSTPSFPLEHICFMIYNHHNNDDLVFQGKYCVNIGLKPGQNWTNKAVQSKGLKAISALEGFARERHAESRNNSVGRVSGC